MSIPLIILYQLRERSGLLFESTKEFARLAAEIQAVTGRTIGVTTLKRLFGRTHDTVRPSAYTLDTIARYLGKKNWEALVGDAHQGSGPVPATGSGPV